MKKDKRITHGLTDTRLHTIWLKMRQRCYNKNHTAYKNYGGRGIKICPLWYDLPNGFINFYTWAMHNGYGDELTLDRIDNNGNYTPTNCRWATLPEQHNNTRASRYVTYDGRSMTTAEWARTLNVNYSNFWQSIKIRKFNLAKLLADREDLFNKYENFKNRESKK